MISDFKQIIGLFRELDDKLTSKADLYIIGGAALLYHGIGKPYTKDIDIIIEKEEICDKIVDSLKRIGFRDKTKPPTHHQLEIHGMLERGEFLFDIFHKVVCKGFLLSGGIKKRAVKVLNLKNMRVFVCSREDIFLFKSLADRPKDVEDSIDLIKRGLEWEKIYRELESQSSEWGERKATHLLHFQGRLEKLENGGIDIPIKKKVEKLLDPLIFE